MAEPDFDEALAMRISRKGWFWTIFLTLSFHLMIAAYLLWTGIGLALFWPEENESIAGDRPGDVKPTAGADDVKPNADGKIALDGGVSVNLKSLLEQGLTDADKLSDEEKMSRMSDRVAELNQYDPATVRALGSLIEAIGGSNSDRAYAPKQPQNIDWNPDTQQPFEDVQAFDGDSAAFYAMRKKQNKNGDTVYVGIYVDKDGRWLKSVTQEKHMTAEDRRLYKLYTMAEHNTQFKALFEVARRMAQTRVDEENARQPAPADPSKPGDSADESK